MNWFKKLIKKIKGEVAKGTPVDAPKTRTVGQHEKDFNGWVKHVYRSHK